MAASRRHRREIAGSERADKVSSALCAEAADDSISAARMRLKARRDEWLHQPCHHLYINTSASGIENAEEARAASAARLLTKIIPA